MAIEYSLELGAPATAPDVADRLTDLAVSTGLAVATPVRFAASPSVGTGRGSRCAGPAIERVDLGAERGPLVGNVGGMLVQVQSVAGKSESRRDRVNR